MSQATLSPALRRDAQQRLAERLRGGKLRVYDGDTLLATLSFAAFNVGDETLALCDNDGDAAADGTPTRCVCVAADGETVLEFAVCDAESVERGDDVAAVVALTWE